MTISEIQQQVIETLRSIAKSEFQIDLDSVAAEIPPKTELGDLAFPVAFDLAKRIKLATGNKTNPREIAQKLGEAVETHPVIDRVEIAGAGYLNVFIKRVDFLLENAGAPPLPFLEMSASPDAAKVCVEHTSVNPNKAAHIGHVRNSALGDTFSRILRATGKQVEVQNYIDNTGVQVADVVVGFMFIKNMTLSDIKFLDTELTAADKRFDYYCWDLYASVGKRYTDDPELKSKRAEVLHSIEQGGNETAELADYVATRNVECILATMERLSIRYDLLPRESEILHLHFWDRAFEQMKQLGVINHVAEGAHAGCWVMPVDSHSGADDHEADKILVRSNGTVTYTGKDIAYQMWKLGILGLDFNYRLFSTYGDGKQVWITTAAETAKPDQTFGGGETIYNVIDTRQSYPQDVVRKGVAAISPERGEKASIHLAYEMVALSPAAAEELGFVLSDANRQKSFIEMSGRKGLGVKADDLIDRLEANASLEVKARHPDLPPAIRQHISQQLAIGALRYFLSKFTRNTVIVFDFKEALAFEGETGCFCQYSAVRANSIFRKLDSKDTVEACRARLAKAVALNEFFIGETGSEIWSTIILASRLSDVVMSAAAATEPAILAKYTFSLAKAFNLFYHNHKILAEPDELKRAVLVVTADIVRRSLTAALDTLGIEVPERM
ncbi:MAG: arginine--tRNA ligase [Pyrinomonadaceae bacterium]